MPIGRHWIRTAETLHGGIRLNDHGQLGLLTILLEKNHFILTILTFWFRELATPLTSYKVGFT